MAHGPGTGGSRYRPSFRRERQHALQSRQTGGFSPLRIKRTRQGDRVSVTIFNTSAHEMRPATDDLEAVNRAVRDVLAGHFEGGTHVQTALDEAALAFLRERPSGRRRAVLVLTDDYGTRTRDQMTVVRHLWEADAVVLALLIRHPPSRKAQVLQTAISIAAPAAAIAKAATRARVDKIVEMSGGEMINSDRPGTALEDAIRRMRQRYTLYYRMPPGEPGSARTVLVGLSPDASRRFPDARIYARKGYVVPAVAASPTAGSPP